MTIIKVPLKDLYQSPLNPRTRYDEEKLRHLGESMVTSGQWSPAVVRPRKGGGHEIGAGHRRYGAAKLVGMPTLDCLERAMTDEQFLELLVFENPEHDPLHPLEEARGYLTMMQKLTGYDVAKIADRAHRSVDYVRDRLRLLKLTKPAQSLFLEGEITLAHAILLSRLGPGDQARAIDPREGGLFERESADVDEQLQALPRGDRDPRKARSPKELATWIADCVRLDLKAPDFRELFPETTAEIQRAEADKVKVVLITRDSVVRPEAKSEDGARIYGPLSWRRADDEEEYNPAVGRSQKSKPCEYSVLGVVAVGPGKGGSFAVCVDKKRCRTHWPAAKPKAEPSNSRAEQARLLEDQRRAKLKADRDAAAARWEKAAPLVLAAVAKKVATAGAGSRGPLADILIADYRRRHARTHGGNPLPLGKSAEDLVRHLAYGVLQEDATGWGGHESFPKVARKLGVDVAKILKGIPAPKAAAE